ncbi:endonuclease-reverse transcriptase [Clonorchis sinensis]|uniref:Endonuclease-reverse transcriptase n=1 Tax=Clonorchis sinensis TaxID=79923 RepID=G7Y7Q1_CLOSI|nr:endonuclease-reverse transcriptase [Clonorchis sinensis]
MKKDYYGSAASTSSSWCRLGILDASLGELRVQQLQTGLTTLFGFNVLVTFDNVHYKTSGASAPVPTGTQERLVGLTCEECGKWCKSKAGLVAHHRVHDNDSVGTNMVAQLACADCSRLFPTKIGLSQHRRHAHPTQHNADKLSRVKHSGARWSQQESQSLLRLANNLYPSCETQTALFARLEQYFPGRSAISIKTRLRVLNWRAQQDESSSQDISTHLENCIPTPSSVSPSDAGQPKADLPSQLRRHPDPIPPKTERCSVCCARWVMERSVQRQLRPTSRRRAVLETGALSPKTRGQPAQSRSSTIRLELDRAHHRRGSRPYGPFNGQFVPRPGQAHTQDAPPVQCERNCWVFQLTHTSWGLSPHLCLARITLVPKVPNPTSPDQLRPISVSSILVRCFHKVLADCP